MFVGQNSGLRVVKLNFADIFYNHNTTTMFNYIRYTKIDQQIASQLKKTQTFVPLCRIVCLFTVNISDYFRK